MHKAETLRKFTYGSVTVDVATYYDDTSDDTEYFGRGVDNPDRQPKGYSGYAYHRPSGIMRLPNGTFRDKRGRIASDPEEAFSFRASREYEWIAISDASGSIAAGPQSLKYAFQDAERLDAYYRNEWAYVGVVATVTMHVCTRLFRSEPACPGPLDE